MATEIPRLLTEALYLLLLLSAPVLAVSLILGVAVGLFQAVTQLQEPTLSFVPRLLGVGVALVVAGAWMGRELVSFAGAMLRAIPVLVP